MTTLEIIAAAIISIAFTLCVGLIVTTKWKVK